jgi:glycosyltransferase involved in cell wall biosynthesis
LVLDARPDAGDRIALVAGGIDGTQFTPGIAAAAAVRARWQIPADRSFLLTVRRLEPRMGLEELLQALRLLLDRGHACTLGIAGAGMLEPRLRELATRLELLQDVRFLGRVPEQDLAPLYATADLFVLPTVAYEGFGMATIEALACGTPVVGTSVGATPELLRPLEPELIAPSPAPNDLATAVERALGRTDLGPRCAEYAHRRYDWERVIEGWESALTFP